jgi:hypothetical protein
MEPIARTQLWQQIVLILLAQPNPSADAIGQAKKSAMLYKPEPIARTQLIVLLVPDADAILRAKRFAILRKPELAALEFPHAPHVLTRLRMHIILGL